MLEGDSATGVEIGQIVGGLAGLLGGDARVEPSLDRLGLSMGGCLEPVVRLSPGLGQSVKIDPAAGDSTSLSQPPLFFSVVG